MSFVVHVTSVVPKANKFSESGVHATDLYNRLKQVDSDIKVCFLTASSEIYREELKKERHCELSKEPQMNGYELVKRIRNLQSQVKIILMSAFETNHLEMAKVLPDIKIDSLVSKPISLGNLEKTIVKHLR